MKKTLIRSEPLPLGASMDLSISVSTLKLKNPTMLASGILGETGASMLRVARSGAGAIVTKSIGLKARSGYQNPIVVETRCGIINALGLPNPGIECYEEEVKTALKGDVPVIGSIFGSEADEFSELAIAMESYGVHALELNLSCPHAKGYGAEIGQDPENVYEITRAVKKAVRPPVFVKLTPNVSDIASLARAVEDARGDGVVAINTLRAMAIDIEIFRPVLSNTVGGYSGEAIKPVGVRCVYEIYKECRIPIIGVGGIANARDALEYIIAGASAVQIGSAIRIKGGGSVQ